MTLFEIFGRQLPIELHENALYALLNLFSGASKKVKDLIVAHSVKTSPQKGGKTSGGGFSHLLRFSEDLFKLEYEVVRGDGKMVIVDCGVRQNPLLEAAQFKEEKTIEEMQAFVFDQKYYEYNN